MPERPAVIAAQVSSLPCPREVTRTIPVTATSGPVVPKRHALPQVPWRRRAPSPRQWPTEVTSASPARPRRSGRRERGADRCLRLHRVADEVARRADGCAEFSSACALPRSRPSSRSRRRSPRRASPERIGLAVHRLRDALGLAPHPSETTPDRTASASTPRADAVRAIGERGNRRPSPGSCRRPVRACRRRGRTASSRGSPSR